MTAPPHPKIYHIVHLDRLSSIIQDEFIWCDTEISRRNASGTVIGMSGIKQRRLGCALRVALAYMWGTVLPFTFAHVRLCCF